MKTGGTPHQYISGPHSGDYYLLLDERSDYIFATRLAEYIREAIASCDERAGLATPSLLEIWMDDTEKHVWYLFEVCRSDQADSRQPGSREAGQPAQP
jgi:starvation-inducible DNA-binding protein